MTLRIRFAIGVAVAVIVLPIIIVQAQSEGEVVLPVVEEVVVEEQSEAEGTTLQEESEPAAEPQQETKVEGDTASDAAPEGEASNDNGTAEDEPGGSLTEQPTTTPPVTEGSVLGEATTTETVPNSQSSASKDTGPTPQIATTTVEIDLVVDTASTTEATSTPPVDEPKPVEEPLVLQPGVALSINGNTMSAVVTLQNLTSPTAERSFRKLKCLSTTRRGIRTMGLSLTTARQVSKPHHKRSQSPTLQ